MMFLHCLVKHSPSDTNRFLCSPPPVALILTILIFIQVETVHGCEEQAITESKQIDINLSIEKDDFPLQNQSVVLAAHKQKETLEENLQGCSSGSPAAHGSSRLGRSLGQLGQDTQKEILILVGAEQDQTGPTRLAEISCLSHKIQNGHLAKFVFVVGIFSTLLAVLQQNGAWLLPKTSTKLLLPSHSHMRSSSEARILMQSTNTVLALLKHLCYWSFSAGQDALCFHTALSAILAQTSSSCLPQLKGNHPNILVQLTWTWFSWSVLTTCKLLSLFLSWIWCSPPFILWPCLTLLFCFCDFISKYDHEAVYKTHPRSRTQFLT